MKKLLVLATSLVAAATLTGCATFCSSLAKAACGLAPPDYQAICLAAATSKLMTETCDGWAKDNIMPTAAALLDTVSGYLGIVGIMGFDNAAKMKALPETVTAPVLLLRRKAPAAKDAP